MRGLLAQVGASVDEDVGAFELDVAGRRWSEEGVGVRGRFVSDGSCDTHRTASLNKRSNKPDLSLAKNDYDKRR